MKKDSENQTWWRPLGIPGTYISTRSAGDLGPSGWDTGALIRRSRFWEQVQATGNWAGKWTQDQLLVCHQVHSQKILVLLRGYPPTICEAVWDKAGQVQLVSTALSQPDNCPNWLELNSNLPKLVGQQDADGLISDVEEVILAVTVADCLPAMLSARSADGRLIQGALHSGWGGTGILFAALAWLATQNVCQLAVQLGPCIAARHYPVPVQRAHYFEERFGQSAVKICADGQPGLDLIAANLAIIEGSAPCLDKFRQCNRGTIPWQSPDWRVTTNLETNSTFELDWAHSYRRDGAENYGRMLCMIMAQY